MKNWTLDQLKTQLNSRPEAKSWIITQETTHRRERYFMLDGPALVTDQDRNVHAQGVTLRLFVNLPNKPGRQGEITKRLFPSVPLIDQIDLAIEAALQTDHQAWELPSELPPSLPTLRTTDPRMGEDLEKTVAQVTAQIQQAVARERRTRFNSAELFMSVHHSELHLSNGLTHRSSQSRIYTEAAYSFSQGERSDEYLKARWAVTLDDLPVQELFDETSDRAEHSLNTAKPVTGTYPVIVDAEVLATLFNSQLGQLSSGNAYHGLPFVKPGSELIPGATGDRITLRLDPTLEFGADTTAISDQGIAQTAFKLVDGNRVTATATDKRYADYLGTSATTSRGNIVVDGGSLSHDELAALGPQVIEILQFSGLFTDPNSGTFGSEIRLARLYDNRSGKTKVTYLKGGSLSGSFVENFRGARLSRQRVKRALFHANNTLGEGYYGPAYALLSDVSIVG